MSLPWTTYRNAGYPAIAIETIEEERFLTTILEQDDRPVFVINALGGLRDARTGQMRDPRAGYPQAWTEAGRTLSILVALDWHHIVRNAAAYRALRETLPAIKARGSCVLLLAPTWSLPPELEHEIPVLQWALPTRSELRAALDVCAQAVGHPVDQPTADAALDAAAGLTLNEAEGAFALALADRGTFDRTAIETEKLKLLRQVTGLEVAPPASPDSIGGLDGLKTYLTTEVIPAKDDPDLRVRGLLLIGIPGTGKSLSARAAGAWLNWPVIRLDLAACKGSLVGQSEANLRRALQVVEAIAPAVVWLDEIEKAVGGYASSAQTDSGVTLGLVGTLLTWLQEHTAPLLVVATCNDYAKLPAELTRAGRLDERFFVDLPTAYERQAIAQVHLRRHAITDQDFSSLIADLTPDWTGAEIEALVKSTARRTRRAFTASALRDAAADIKPLAHVRAHDIAQLREWARGTLRLANSPISDPSLATPRTIRLESSL
jgi:SpoVK/Ycf46/Vps4 family AAA+-type ATPase